MRKPTKPTTSELVDLVRTLEIDHDPHGWPAIKMNTVSALADKIESLQTALKIISTWATFNGGSELIPKDVEFICKKHLND